jgi:alcohol dehydrogenase class IV
MTPSITTHSLQNVGKIIAGPGSLSAIEEIPAASRVRDVLFVTDCGVWNAGLIEKPQAEDWARRFKCRPAH